jgi:hypothetical protein
MVRNVFDEELDALLNVDITSENLLSQTEYAKNLWVDNYEDLLFYVCDQRDRNESLPISVNCS